MIEPSYLLAPPEPQDEAQATYEFDVTSRPDKRPGVVMRWGGREVVHNEIPIETGSFPYALVKYCIWGNGVYESDSERWDIVAGDVFWSFSNHPNSLTVSKNGAMANYAVVFAGRDATTEMERYFHTPVGVTKLRDPEQVASVMRAIMSEGRGTADHREENCTLLAKLLLRRVQAQGKAPAESNALARQTFKRCREFIERNFATLTTLKSVADACDVTVPYLCRLFDQFFDGSPYEYMTRLKMNRAESLLLRPAAPVHEIAQAVGYKDPRLFARNFKAAFGKSPTKYRQLHIPVAQD